MKVAKKTEYGLRAMVCLALSGGQKQAVALPVVAQAEQIPEQFLDQIFAKLRRAGFVKSVRGVNGGYLLSRPPEEISIGELVRVLEGSLSPIGCVTEENSDPGDFCGRFSACHTRNVWLRVMNAITHALDSLTLAEVMHDDVEVRQVLQIDSVSP
ncbi:RrF2 family transcriptional regulator [Alicyclobacillus ferrooxydans]|uniref:AsnC family transcriptional regulator n=1 Tax=Alicyclobacillus ferrooxydans TaxID=471514 RepID=A0A0P9CV87_9BACL|nr:Rrf2 family transcriptional regulator [Alicyclobacillus ferrooxydans]KPV43599.1 AsnC family transcriptional regulator [Alicyclobacillus ferrooxydans]